MGEPPGQPKASVAPNSTPGSPVGREAPWKGSIEFLGGAKDAGSLPWLVAFLAWRVDGGCCFDQTR